MQLRLLCTIFEAEFSNAITMTSRYRTTRRLLEHLTNISVIFSARRSFFASFGGLDSSDNFFSPLANILGYMVPYNIALAVNFYAIQ